MLVVNVDPTPLDANFKERSVVLYLVFSYRVGFCSIRDSVQKANGF